jgi:hypothetical protein
MLRLLGRAGGCALLLLQVGGRSAAKVKIVIEQRHGNTLPHRTRCCYCCRGTTRGHPRVPAQATLETIHRFPQHAACLQHVKLFILIVIKNTP